MKSIQINGQFTVLDYHTGTVLSSKVDYDIVAMDDGKYVVPRSIEPIIFLEKVDGIFRAYFFNGASWSETESTFVDTDDLPVEALVTIIGKFFVTVTSRGNRVFLRTIKQWRVAMANILPSFFATPVAVMPPIQNAPIMVRA